MKLIHVNIQLHHSISEPTEFDVETDATALVGKNESGKTAVLQSLYKSNLVDRVKFNLDLNYPSHKIPEPRRKNNIKVTELTYEFDDDDIAAVEAVLCSKVLEYKRIAVTTGFHFNLFLIMFQSLLNHGRRCIRTASPTARHRTAFRPAHPAEVHATMTTSINPGATSSQHQRDCQ